MPQLATLLLEEITAPGAKPEWAAVAEKLRAGVDLEKALDDVGTDSALLDEIVATVAREVVTREAEVLAQMASGDLKLPLSGLIELLARVNPGRMVIVTTNYDRLVEAAVEHAGLLVDCSFPGSYFSPFDPSQASLAFATPGPRGGAAVKRQHITVAKPHGSLDWYATGAGPVRSVVEIDAPRLIITPGSSKYERGYERPFDHHRECGNAAVKRAKSLVFVGYGFNDSHLQTHLDHRLRSGAPAVIVARTLSASAKALLADSPEALAFERVQTTDPNGADTRIHFRGEAVEVAGALWALESLTASVLS